VRPVGNVNIQVEYLAGRKTANDLLESYFLGIEGVNFEKIFSKPDVDHLQGGVGIRMPDQGLVGRSGRQA
jgi:hypothetical protein